MFLIILILLFINFNLGFYFLATLGIFKCNLLMLINLLFCYFLFTIFFYDNIDFYLNPFFSILEDYCKIFFNVCKKLVISLKILEMENFVRLKKNPEIFYLFFFFFFSISFFHIYLNFDFEFNLDQLEIISKLYVFMFYFLTLFSLYYGIIKLEFLNL
jgi:hypothetical protein